jgi:hypothetical protein
MIEGNLGTELGFLCALVTHSCRLLLCQELGMCFYIPLLDPGSFGSSLRHYPSECLGTIPYVIMCCLPMSVDDYRMTVEW